MFVDYYFRLRDVRANISHPGPIHGRLLYHFIDHVDTEYSFRAMCKGVPVYINTSLVLRHEVGKRLDHKLLFFKLVQWNTPPPRLYYSARNCVHLSRRYGARFPLLVLINIITMQLGVA